MTNGIIKDDDNEDMSKAVTAGSTTSRTITFDYERYQAYLDESDLSEDQKRDVLEALWSIIVSFVDLGFGVHPLQQACGKLPEISRKSSKRAVNMVSCDKPLNQEFKSVTAQHCCNEARE